MHGGDRNEGIQVWCTLYTAIVRKYGQVDNRKSDNFPRTNHTLHYTNYVYKYIQSNYGVNNALLY